MKLFRNEFERLEDETGRWAVKEDAESGGWDVMRRTGDRAWDWEFVDTRPTFYLAVKALKIYMRRAGEGQGY